MKKTGLWITLTIVTLLAGIATLVPHWLTLGFSYGGSCGSRPGSGGPGCQDWPMWRFYPLIATVGLALVFAALAVWSRNSNARANGRVGETTGELPELGTEHTLSEPTDLGEEP